MRKLLSFVEPTLGLTYQDLYSELGDHLALHLEETLKRFTPDEAPDVLRYHRRQVARRLEAERLAERLGVEVSVVHAACTPEGIRLLLEALEIRDAAFATA
ncbi:MAG: hypothetical protein VKO21_08645 [Candidatus Sericytochromatia bacterium]|nr:hypothetical protein [Candidatus Sericytochromatia bacterium]